jgi:hypothetical protein
MGFFYVTTYIDNPDSTAIVAFLETLHRHAYVLPPRKGYMVIYDEQAASEDPCVIETLTRALSDDFNGKAISICNRDDDTLTLWIFAQGQPVAITAAALASLFGKEKRRRQLETTLHQTGYDAGERHRRLAQILALPFKYAQFGFSELLENDRDLGNTNPFRVKVASRKLLRSFGDTDGSKPFHLERELRRLIQQHKIISAVSLYQQRTGVPFQEARQHIETITQQRSRS